MSSAQPQPTRPFIHEDFLLSTRSARDLYHTYAAAQPILDYHCHLSARDIADNRRFSNLYEIWLEGDHYKWRAMRANGIAEDYCTGSADPYDKFLAWARTVPYTIANPLYHWTHLELKRYFGIDELLNEQTAPAIWERANAMLATEALTAQAILKKFNVKVVCTTDDPTDDLADHQRIAQADLGFRVYPTFRPDKALRVDDPESFNEWTVKLEKRSNTEIRGFEDFLRALRSRHHAFERMGARLSDHGLEHCYASFCSEAVASGIFDKVRSGRAASPEEHAQFASYLMLFFGHLDAEKNWTKQLHLGARRNANTRALETLGPDTGFDSIGDWPQINDLGHLPGSTGAGERASADDRLQPESRGQLRDRHHVRELPGWIDSRQNSVWERLVVPRPETRHRVAVAGSSEYRTAVAFRWHGHRFALLHVVSTPRIFPPRSLQLVRRSDGIR